jgi:protein-arginine deiminase
MMVGRTFPVYNAAGNYVGERNAEIDVATYLADAAAQRFNAEVQGKLNRVKQTLRRQLGMDGRAFPDPNVIIELPVLYMRTPEGFADAMTAGVANMIVVNNHCIVPDPFGPVSGGVDLFQQDIRNKLTPLGLTVHFLDDWNTYHVALGEVHCGTNTKRQITPTRWWEFQP